MKSCEETQLYFISILPGGLGPGLGRTGGLIPGTNGALPVIGITGVGRTGRRGL